VYKNVLVNRFTLTAFYYDW